MVSESRGSRYARRYDGSRFARLCPRPGTLPALLLGGGAPHPRRALAGLAPRGRPARRRFRGARLRRRHLDRPPLGRGSCSSCPQKIAHNGRTPSTPRCARNCPTPSWAIRPTSAPPDPADNGVQRLQPIEQGPVNHRVTLHTAADFVAEIPRFRPHPAPGAGGLADLPHAEIAHLTAGAVYHDGAGLEAVRSRFAFYPHDVWLYLLAAGWGASVRRNTSWAASAA